MGHVHIHVHDAGNEKVEKTMHEFKHGELHSGSKKGPRVKSRKQAIAIALKQAGKSNQDAGTSEGARKAAITRKAHGGGGMNSPEAHARRAALREKGENLAAKKESLARQNKSMRSHSGGGSVAYPHSTSTHKARAEHLENQAAKFSSKGLHGVAQQYRQVAGMHKKAAGMSLNTPEGRKYSEKVHKIARANRMDTGNK